MTIANTTLLIKKSGLSGNIPSSLNYGELGLNYADGKLYYKNAGGTIVTFNTSGANSFSTINSNSSLILASSNNDTLSIVPGNNITISSNTTSKAITISLANNVSIANTLTVSGSGGNITGANTIYANTVNLSSSLIFPDGTVQTTAASGASTDQTARNLANSAYNLASYAANTANSASANTNYLSGVQSTQNTNITAVNNFAQSAYNQANSISSYANTEITYILGIESTQNTNITYATSLAQAAFNQANTGSGTTVTISNNDTSNNVYYINFTSNTSGTANTLYTSSNNLTFIPSTGTLGVQSINLTNNANIYSNVANTGANSTVTIDSFPTTLYRSAFYQFQISTSGEFESLNLNLIHNGITANTVVSGDVYTTETLGTFSASITSKVVNILFTPKYTGTSVVFIRNAIGLYGLTVPTGDLGYIGQVPNSTYDAGYDSDSVTTSFDYGAI